MSGSEVGKENENIPEKPMIGPIYMGTVLALDLSFLEEEKKEEMKKKWYYYPLKVFTILSWVLLEIAPLYFLIGILIVIGAIIVGFLFIICIIVIGPYYLLKEILGLPSLISWVLTIVIHAVWMTETTILAIQFTRWIRKRNEPKRLQKQKILQEKKEREIQFMNYLRNWEKPYTRIEEKRDEPAGFEKLIDTREYIDRCKGPITSQVPETPEEYYAKRWKSPDIP